MTSVNAAVNPGPNAGACARTGQVDRHFAGRLSPAGEGQLRRHLVDCNPCRRRYQRHLQLGKLDPRALGMEERLRRGLGLAPPPARRTAWFALAGTAVAALVLLLPVLPRWQGDRSLDPAGATRARGAGLAALPLVLALDDRGTEVAAFRTSGPGAPAPASARIARGQELAFAYRNGGAWSHLMVFARDERGAIYWFYPQWTDPALDPEGVALQATPELRELPAAVSHDFAGHQLALCALASRRPMSTRQVEQALLRAPGRWPAAVFPGAEAGGDRAIACLPVEVIE
jgi:hypothetical protein